MQVARDQLAGKEMTVGRFYMQRRNWTAAINRFREVLAKYQRTRHTEEALYRLTEAYLALGIPSEAQTAAAVLGHNYPDSQWYKDAFCAAPDRRAVARGTSGILDIQDLQEGRPGLTRGVRTARFARLLPPRRTFAERRLTVRSLRCSSSSRSATSS